MRRLKLSLSQSCRVGRRGQIVEVDDVTAARLLAQNKGRPTTTPLVTRVHFEEPSWYTVSNPEGETRKVRGAKAARAELRRRW